MSAINCTPEEVVRYYANRFPQVKQSGPEWRGPCPIHHGKNDSFAVNPETGEWYCHSGCGEGGDILKLELATSGSDFSTCKATVLQIVGTAESEYPCDGELAGTAPSQPAKADFPFHQWTEVERYAYQDANGDLLFEVIRYKKPDGQKVFRQCRPDGEGGVIWNLEGIDRVPYRLPKLFKAETIYLAEGEKDVHTLEQWGLVASCNPGGSGTSKLYMDWAKLFAGCHVVILPDNDEPGRKHALAVATALLGSAASIRIVELAGSPPKGDVTDWRDQGHTSQELSTLTEVASPLNPKTLSALRKSWGSASQKAGVQERVSVLVTKCLSDIEAKPVSWLWQGRIARGKVTIIAGDPGLGKSQLTASIAAIVTTGGLWPVDQQQCKPGKVVFLNAEDNPADTLRPRLEAAGADPNYVHIVYGVMAGYAGRRNDVQKQFSLQEDLQALDRTVEKLGNVAAVVIDPISAYLGSVDSHRDANVRALLAPLGDLAARHNTAIICISHLNKAVGTQALLRVMGSVGFVAAARAAFLVAADPNDRARRFFVSIKNNIGPDDKGLAFHIEPATVLSLAGPLSTSRLMWESEFVSETADEIMRSGTTSQGTSALAGAVEWLGSALEGGPVGVSKVKEEAKADGITLMTLRRAADELHVVKQKASMNGGWLWFLPTKAINPSKAAQEQSLSPFGGPEHLPDIKDMADKL